MPSRSFTAADGARIAFQDPNPDAPGVPVLALAGLTRAGSDFDFLRPHVPGLRLVSMDYRGRGESDRTGAETYTVPQEAADAVALLDHLGIGRAGLIGTSRGGLISMVLAALHPDRLAGVLLNDIGPVLAPGGLEVIKGYVGRRPAARTLDAAAEARAIFAAGAGFADVPSARWREEVGRHYREGPDGLDLNYDPALREALIAGGANPAPDLWPLFEALPRPLAALRGAGSDLLTAETFAEMRRRRPDMMAAEVPGRGHIPFLDEPESLALIRAWLDAL